jgi:4-hydroxybutyrate CoA-transferase
MPKTIPHAAICEHIKPGMRVYVGGGACEPHGLVDALREAPDAGQGVTFIQSIVPGLTCTDFSALHEDARIVTFFMTPQTQDAYDAGKVDFVPMQLRVISDYLRETPIDVALIQVARTSDPNVFSPGMNADYIDSVLANAKCIIAECNEQLPTPLDATPVPASKIDYLVEASYPLAAYPLVDPGADARAIGHHVASLVRDGDCVQSGIGAIPYAVMSQLKNKNDLGLHSGIIDDAAQGLVDLGVLTGAAKNIDKGKHVAASALGTREFYAWTSQHPHVQLRPYSYTHAASVLIAMENFVSINSAMEIDFHGQVNSEMIKGRQITGTGGAVDFMRGAAAAKGGRSIIALTSTAAGGKLSRIIPQLAAGNAATALRTDIDYVVTEHGIAHLRYQPLRERARALISIADPKFRDELTVRAQELFGRA